MFRDIVANTRSIMIDHTAAQEFEKVRQPEKRALLIGSLAAYSVTFIPSAFAISTVDPGREAFLTVSKSITGRSLLNSGLAERLYSALIIDNPKFATDIQSLSSLIVQDNIDLLQLQKTLDADYQTLSKLPKNIAKAWFTGIVGDGAQASCIAYELNLVNVLLDDRLKPPGYCFGTYGSWTKNPT